MGMDMNRLRSRRDDDKKSPGGGKKGAKFFSFEVGRTVLYLCPPTDVMDGVAYVPVLLHGNVGPKGDRVACLCPENEALYTDPMTNALGKKKTPVELNPHGTCPVCDWLEGEDGLALSEDKRKRMEARKSYFMGIIPWERIDKEGKRKPYPEGDRKPAILIAGFKVWDGMMEAIDTLDRDITDPASAVLLVVKRVGLKFNDTKYAVSACPKTTATALVLPKPQRAVLREAQKEGGDLDLFRLIANVFVKSPEQLEEMLGGGEVEERKVEAEDPDQPHCFAIDCDPEDDTCKGCAFKEACAAKCEVDVPEDLKEEKPPPKAKATPPAPVKGKPATPSAATSKGKPSAPKKTPDPEPEDEPDDDAEPDEPAPTPTTHRVTSKEDERRRRAAAAKKPAPAPDPEPEDEEVEPDDAEPAEVEETTLSDDDAEPGDKDDAVDEFEKELADRRGKRAAKGRAK